MHSLRTRITLLTVWVVVIAVTVVSLLSVMFIRNNEHRQSDQLLLTLCEIGEKNLNYYFDSVQKSVGKIVTFIEKDLEGVEDERLQRHIDRVERYFDETIYKTNGVLTYYYRVDPAVSDTVKGFWYTNLDGEGFVPHEVTDITLYDTQDTSRLVWFTVPKYTGKAVWQPPYITDNLDVRVISYNVPIYWRGQFVGVVGIEIDYSTMAGQVESIRLYNNGYAFLSDNEGNIFFHPRIDVAALTKEAIPNPPEGITSSSTFFRYTFEGEEKQAAWLSLSNGMRLNVTVPVSETEGDWKGLIRQIVIVSGVVLLVLSLFTLSFTGHITRPLEQLTQAAEQVDKGNYDFSLEYHGDDEVGRLTNSFKKLASNVKEHIIDLNKRVYVDALTSVKNKGAFSAALSTLQSKMDEKDPRFTFAVGVFDCDNLKTVNDQFGHDKGDLYLKTACQLICRVFHHSPVFRIGGDEFAVILENEDYNRREELVRAFYQEAEEISASHENIWEQVHVAMGLAVYDPNSDGASIDTVRRADKNMYETKRQRKAKR